MRRRDTWRDVAEEGKADVFLVGEETLVAESLLHVPWSLSAAPGWLKSSV